MTVVKASRIVESATPRVFYEDVSTVLVHSEAPSKYNVTESENLLPVEGAAAGREDTQTLQLETAYQRGFNDGIDEGRLHAEDAGERAAIELGASLARAVEVLDRHLSESGELARQLTLLVVKKLGSNSEVHAPMVEAVIQTALRGVSAGQLLSLDVAEADFPEESPLNQMRQQLGLASVQVNILPDALSGTCRLNLHGEVMDASVRLQLEKAMLTIERALSHAN